VEGWFISGGISVKSTALSELMVKDHVHILKLLKEVTSHLGDDVELVMRVFQNFKWHIEKHFFVEERAIFTAYNPEHVFEGYDIFLDLSKEHTTILDRLHGIERMLMKKEKVDLSNLGELLVRHKTFEEKSIYPVLDKEIDEGEKKFIIQRISEII
jgi:hypothetical protein